MRSILAALGISALFIAGCGSDSNDDSASSPPATSTPAATTTAAKAAATADPEIKATEFAFTPSDATVTSGKVKITMKNAGSAEHELVLLKTDQPADSLKVTNGRVSETDSVGEIGETAAGKSASHTFDLKPGTYVMVCNIPGHYQAGMRGTLTVQ